VTRARLALGLIIAAAAVSFVHALWVGEVTDDAGISLAYARSFAQGQGLRLTPLSARVEAYSNPLWVLWLAVGYALRLDGPAFAHVSGAVFGSAAVAVIGLVPSRVARRELQPLDAATPWILAFDTTFNFWSGAGLESGAFAFALSCAMLLINHSSGLVPAAALCLLRPEGPSYVAALALAQRGSRAQGLQTPSSMGSHLFCVLRWCALAALPLVVWIVFRRTYYGQWLPNAYFAKRRWDYGGIAYLWGWFRQDAWHWTLCAAPLAFLTACTRRAAALASLPCVAAAVFILYSSGDWMGEYRLAAHALAAAALLAGLLPATLADLVRLRGTGTLCAVTLVAVAATGARNRTPDRKRNPELPLEYIAEQGRWFRATARRLGLLRPRIAHFDLGGLALESGGEVIDLAGLADVYIGRVGYQDRRAVEDYVFDEVKPDLLNIHGPCSYLRDDPRLTRDYQLAAKGSWGENWVTKSLALKGIDHRCPDGVVPTPDEMLTELESDDDPIRVRDLWLCARAHLPVLPDVRTIAARFAWRGMREPDHGRALDLLDAAVTLDPLRVAEAQVLLDLRLGRAQLPR
jgi:hypothetical protein